MEFGRFGGCPGLVQFEGRGVPSLVGQEPVHDDGGEYVVGQEVQQGPRLFVDAVGEVVVVRGNCRGHQLARDGPDRPRGTPAPHATLGCTVSYL